MAKRNFKSILSLIISLTLIIGMLSVPFTASAAVVENSTLTELISDGAFEDYDEGDNMEEKTNWGEGNTAAPVTKKVVSTTGKDGKATNAMELKLTVADSNEKSSFYRNVGLTNPAGIYVLSFDANMVSVDKNAGFWIQLNKEESTGTAKNGSLIFRNYYYASKGMSFKESKSDAKYLFMPNLEQWYNYKIVCNTVNNKAAFYLDGEAVLPLEDLKDNGLKLDTIGSVTFYIANGNNANDSVLFDNISLTYQTIAEYDATNTLPDTLTYEGSNLTLPTAGEMGSTIKWQSSNPDVITEDGAVIPSTEEDKTVTLTATVTDTTGATATVEPYVITVPKAASQEAIDAANAAADAEAIVLPAYTGQEKLDLPKVGSVYGSEITWASDSSVINAETGAITLPKEDTVVTLTATIKNGSAETTKTFTYKFYEKGTIFSEDFSYPAVEDNHNVITDGFNGWTVGYEDNASRVEDTTALIIDEKLVIRQGNAGSSSKQYTMNKNFPLVTNGVATFTMEAVIPENNGFKLNASGFYVEIGGLQIQVRFSRYRVRVVDGSWGTDMSISGVDCSEGKKFSLQVTMNLDTQKASVSVNGETYYNEYDLGALNGITMYPLRYQSLQSGVTETEFAIDNIKITHATSKLQIADLSFVDENGAAVIGRTNGGKLSGVTVAAIDEDIPSARIFAVVYESDGKTISSVAVGGETNLVKNVSKTITFDNPAALPAEDAENAVVKLFAWTADGLVPLNLSPYEYTKTGQQIKFVVCGDSISCNYNPEKTNIVGMGMELGEYFDSEKVSILNIAKSGASTKTFWEDRQELQNNLGSINSGDYVLLMFGHNDSSKADKGTTPEEYKAYLTKMINLVRTKGAIPVLLSPVVRNIWNEDGATLDNSSLKVYTDAMYELSQELNIKYIDVNTATKNLLEGYGKDSAEINAFYLLDKDYNAGLVTEYEYDTTHLTKTGASTVAGIVAEAFEENGWLPAGYYIGE